MCVIGAADWLITTTKLYYLQPPPQVVVVNPGDLEERRNSRRDSQPEPRRQSLPPPPPTIPLPPRGSMGEEDPNLVLVKITQRKQRVSHDDGGGSQHLSNVMYLRSMSITITRYHTGGHV